MVVECGLLVMGYGLLVNNSLNVGYQLYFEVSCFLVCSFFGGSWLLVVGRLLFLFVVGCWLLVMSC